MLRPAARWLLWVSLVTVSWAATPVTVPPVTAPHGMVVAGHPEAAAIGVAVLRAGGNAIDAAVATSLALGVAEPYGSGLGGKLMLLYHEARSGQTFAIDAMDAAGTGFDVATLRQLSPEAQDYGYPAVCVPGLPGGLWVAHAKWGAKPWADNVRPAIELARSGFLVLPKSRDMFEEQEKKLRRGDPEIARLYLPADVLPAVGSRLRNEDLVRTLERLASHGRDGFYRGPVAEAIVAAVRKGGGALTLEDFAGYAARLVEPVGVDFRGYRVVSAPPPTIGAALFLPALKALEPDDFGGGPLRTAANLDRIGRVWGAVSAEAWTLIADVPAARANFEKLMAPASIRDIRTRASAPLVPVKKAAWRGDPFRYENPMAATTHFIVWDAQGNLVCATQSLSLHFGAGVVAPGTGVVLNDSMGNFNYEDPQNVAFVAPGRRPRSTIAPTIVLRAGRPVLAIGVPGATRIPTALLQTLLDRLVLHRPLAEAIGDTRVHYVTSARSDVSDKFEAELSFPDPEAKALQALGWNVVLPEAAGRGRHFGGINAVESNADGTLTGFADPRRTNAAAGY